MECGVWRRGRKWEGGGGLFGAVSLCERPLTLTREFIDSYGGIASSSSKDLSLVAVCGG